MIGFKTFIALVIVPLVLCMSAFMTLLMVGLDISSKKCDDIKTTCNVSSDALWRPIGIANFTNKCPYDTEAKDAINLDGIPFTIVNCYYAEEILGICPKNDCDKFVMPVGGTLLICSFIMFGVSIIWIFCSQFMIQSSGESSSPGGYY